MTTETTNTQTQTQTPAPGTPEYNAAMATKFDQSQQTPAATNVTAMPDGGFEKFYDKKSGAYDWPNHVKELNYKHEQALKKNTTTEQAQTQTQTNSQSNAGTKPNLEVTNAEPPKGADGKPLEGQALVDHQVGQFVEKAGLKLADVRTELEKNGKLSQDQNAALQKIGIPQVLIDEYVEGYGFRAEQARNVALEYVGGQKEWDRILTWARDNLKPEEKVSVNKELAGGNWRMAIDSLKHRAGRGEGNLVTTGGSNPAGNLAGYATRMDMTSAINALNERGQRKYDIDSQYRAEVQQRIQLSNF